VGLRPRKLKPGEKRWATNCCMVQDMFKPSVR
jgi:hypothetical protein